MVYLRRGNEPLRDGPQAVSEMLWHDRRPRRGMGQRADGGGQQPAFRWFRLPSPGCGCGGKQRAGGGGGRRKRGGRRPQGRGRARGGADGPLPGEPGGCYGNSGIQRAIETYARKHHAGDSLRVYHVEDRKFQRTDIAGALVLREWDLYRDALEADKIVNVPVAKHHSLATVTLGLKNMMGVMGRNRGQIHFYLPECLAGINRRIPSHLTVIDATRVLLRNGPSGGNLEDVKAVSRSFASADVVAADVVAAE